MKKDIHPDYHEIAVVMTDGSEFKTALHLREGGETALRLEIDPKTHSAWTGVHRVAASGGQMQKFSQRFGNLGNLSGKKK
ncbi:MAG: 50S ribosomal protein L31 [Xanthomonadales bacterium]|nr:50S ribosomal protein L31 [Xanthomonadales bacterium]